MFYYIFVHLCTSSLSEEVNEGAEEVSSYFAFLWNSCAFMTRTAFLNLTKIVNHLIEHPNESISYEKCKPEVF